MLRRLGATALVLAAMLIAGAGPVRADPAGPTDFQSAVVGLDPPVAGVEAGIVGGDSFVRLEVDPATTVEVVGYRGEPYLRFLPGGVVEQNDRSPSAYLNQDRYGAAEVPAEATAGAEPEWRQVASDGAYAWHDHRVHLMSGAPPPGRRPGDVVLEGVVPLVVDGIEVNLSIRSVWQPPPSRVPVALGLGLGVAVALLAWRGVDRAAAAAALLAGAALAVGVVAFRSVPAETAPPWWLWLVPALSLVLIAAARLPGPIEHRARRGRTLAAALLLIGALETAMWSLVRWDWMWRAVLPTAAPFWVDRLVTAAALAGSAAVGLVVVRALTAEGPRRG